MTWWLKNRLPDGVYEINNMPYFSQRLDENNFKEEGFDNLTEAHYWSERICGIACLKMVIKFNGQEVTLKELLDKGIDIGVYSKDVGWIHKGLVLLAKCFDIEGGRESVGTNIEKIAHHIKNGSVVIASVTVGFEAGKQYTNHDGSVYVMPRGGHLVVVYGAEVVDGEVKYLTLHHPSSEKKYEWRGYKVSRDLFLKSFSERGNIIFLSVKNI